MVSFHGTFPPFYGWGLILIDFRELSFCGPGGPYLYLSLSQHNDEMPRPLKDFNYYQVLT